MSQRLILTSALLALCAVRPGTAAPATRRPIAKPAAAPARPLRVAPVAVTLSGAGSEQALLVTGTDATGRSVDLTGSAVYRSTNPKVVTVGKDGLVRIAGDGAATIEVKAGGATAKVTVRTKNARREAPLSFTNDVMPILMKAGCYTGACHAKQGGQNGFGLSVLGYDPEADFYSVARQANGRRVNRLEPGKSLLLVKATLAAPHAGGKRFDESSSEYRLLARWIAEGAPFAQPSEPKLMRVEVEPKESVLKPKAVQRLLVTAFYSDNTTRDVSRDADFRSNEEGIAGAEPGGIVRATDLAGEAAVMTRYMGQVAATRITVPLKVPVRPEAYARLPRFNQLDELVYRKLSQLNLLPSELCDDATFLRRAFLDLIGTLPTAEETRVFLAECTAEVGMHHGDTETRRDREQAPPLTKGGRGGVSPNGALAVATTPPGPPLKRGGEAVSVPVAQHISQKQAPPLTKGGPGGVSPNPGTPSGQQASKGGDTTPAVVPALKARAALVNRLLDRPEYADYWGMRWVNLLLVDRDPLFPKGAYAYDRWVRDAFRDNMPFDQFARDIVTGSGETYRDGPANFYRALATPIEQSKAISQLFLGVRIDCAQCHHHPNERWGQDDFYSMAAFFARVRRKGASEFEQVVYAGPDGEVKHPKTDAVMPPRPLGGAVPEIPDDEDRREHLARWMTSPENPYFARTIVNRAWALLMGRGIVEPVDDMRVTNPATNEPLLDALAKDFVAHGYDQKHLLRTIAASAAYQRSSKATKNNAKDTHNYSRFYVKRLIGEVLLDAVGQVTGVPEKFNGHPATTRAIQMWDNKLPVEFLDVFGKPSRLSVCECDRPADGSVTQVLHLMNSTAIQSRLTKDDGTTARLEKSMLTPEAIVEELYLTVYNRQPKPDEAKAARAAFDRAGATRRAAIEDLLWVLLNSPEFIFNH